MGLGDIGITKASFKTGKGSAVLNVLTDFGRSLTNALRKEIDKQGIEATGNLPQSIRFTARFLGNSYEFKLYMAEYYQWVDKGRKAGKMPPEAPILEWMVAKGVKADLSGLRQRKIKSLKGKERKSLKRISQDKANKQLAYLIRRKIAKSGTKATNFYSNIVSEQFLNGWKSKIAKAAKLDIVESIRIY